MNRPYDYLYRRATMGSRREAFSAGHMPKSRPTLTEAMTEAAMAVRGKPLHI